MSAEFEGRPILQAILNDPSLQAILGDEVSNLVGFLPQNHNQNFFDTLPQHQHDEAFPGFCGDGYKGGTATTTTTSLDQLAQEQNEAVLDDISLRHRCSDLEAENARLRSLLQQQSASTTELTRKLNLRDVVVDGLRKSVIQSQSQNARSLGQPASLGFDVVEALEEELSTAVSAQVRLRESTEAALKQKIERQDRGLRRIIAAKEREIIQLHLQFRQTLVQLRSQHTGDIQAVFEENIRLKRIAAEAEQNALIAAEVQFNTRLRAEQMRIESECEQKIGAKLVEMKYLRECLDTQEAAAKKLDEAIAELNKRIEAKDRMLHHILDVEMPYEINKIKKQLDEYITSDSAQSQIDLANAKVETDNLKTELATAKEAVAGAVRERNDASHAMHALKNEISNKDAQIRDYQSRLNLMQQTVNALERDSEQTAMELQLLRRMQLQTEDQLNSTLGSTMTGGGSGGVGGGGGSPTSTSSSATAELKRQLALHQDENSSLKVDMTKAFEQINKYREDIKSASASRSILQERVNELEKLLQDQISQSQAALDKVQRKLENFEKIGGNANDNNNNNKNAGGASAGAGGLQRRGTRVNILLPNDADGKNSDGTTPSGSSIQRGNSLRRAGSGGKNLFAGGSQSQQQQQRKDSSSSSTSKPPLVTTTTTTSGSNSSTRPNSAASNISEAESGTSSLSASTNPSATAVLSTTAKPKITTQQQQNEKDIQSIIDRNDNENDNNNRESVDDPFSNFGGRWEKSEASYGSPEHKISDRHEIDHGDNADTESRPRRDPAAYFEVRHVGIQCARLVALPQTPGSSMAAANNLLRPTSASSHGRGGGGSGGVGGQTPVQFGLPQQTPVSPKLLAQQQQQQLLLPISSYGGIVDPNNRAPSVLGVNRVDSLMVPGTYQIATAAAGQENSGNTNNTNTSSGNLSQPPSAITQTLHPIDEAFFDQSNNNTNNNNNNDQKIFQRSPTGSDHHRPHSTISFIKNNQQQQQQEQQHSHSNLIGEVEILPDEELQEYGVPSSIEDRQINARLRIELAQIRFEVQFLAPPRFLAQAKAMLSSWGPVEEIEIPLISDLESQNDLFEDELGKRRGFHSLLFPGNLRCARFPYRADPSAEPTDGIDKFQLSLYGDDNIAKRGKDVRAIDAPFVVDSSYNVTRGDLDHLRREFIASAMALSRSAEGMEILRVPISSLLLRPNSASQRVVNNGGFSSGGGMSGVQFAPNTTVGAGFRIYQSSAPSVAAAATTTLFNSAPTSPSRKQQQQQQQRPASGSVRQTWKAPEGYLNVDAVHVPSVSHFATKSGVLLLPRPPSSDRTLHWNEAASSHTGATEDNQNNTGRRQAPSFSAASVRVNVNLDVAAVIADTNQKFGAELRTLEGTDHDESASTVSKKKRDFSNVMKQRLDPGYQSGVEFALGGGSGSGRPTSARTASNTNTGSRISVGGRNGRTIQ